MQNVVHERMQKKAAEVDVKKDEKVDENKGVKVEANMGVKGDTKRVDVKTVHKTGCKT